MFLSQDNHVWTVPRISVPRIRQTINAYFPDARTHQSVQSMNPVYLLNVKKVSSSENNVNRAIVGQLGAYAAQTIISGRTVGIFTGRDTLKSECPDVDMDRAYGYRDRVVIPGRNNILQYVNDPYRAGKAQPNQENVCAMCLKWSSSRCLIIYVATRRIHKGDQIYVGYGSSYWKQRIANGFEVYEPAEILEQDKKKGFKVRWKYFTDQTWEPRENLRNTQVLMEWERVHRRG